MKSRIETFCYRLTWVVLQMAVKRVVSFRFSRHVSSVKQLSFYRASASYARRVLYCFSSSVRPSSASIVCKRIQISSRVLDVLVGASVGGFAYRYKNSQIRLECLGIRLWSEIINYDNPNRDEINRHTLIFISNSNPLLILRTIIQGWFYHRRWYRYYY